MTAKLLASYEGGDITAFHLAVELWPIIKPPNPGLVMDLLPNDIVQRVQKYVDDSQRGQMRNNYGTYATTEQLEAAKRWLDAKQGK